LLRTQRGVRGGYRLIKPPDQITLGAVIRLMDGPLAPIGCVSVTAYQKCRDCPYARKVFCPLQNVMGGVRNAIAQILDNFTLEDFAADKGPPPAYRTRRPPSEKGRRTPRRTGGRPRPRDP
ncbi:MAG: RrF2 family transcriptional regulator, partial [Nitrospirales bacterium]